MAEIEGWRIRGDGLAARQDDYEGWNVVLRDGLLKVDVDGAGKAEAPEAVLREMLARKDRAGKMSTKIASDPPSTTANDAPASGRAFLRAVRDWVSRGG